jgi:ubiquinone/menaquinone biosynthesis C-methylase UbiE
MLKEEKIISSSHGLNYFLDEKRRKVRYRPWLGDSLGFLYDLIMEKNIFPKKFAASLEKHYQILGEMLQDVHNMEVLELAIGSGSAIHFPANDNHYTGSDISVSLLKQARKKFVKYGFKDSEFYVMSSNAQVFEANNFQVCLCILAINFLNDFPLVVQELSHILQPGGYFYGCVPVPERDKTGSPVRGTLYSSEELEEIFSRYNFRFTINERVNWS